MSSVHALAEQPVDYTAIKQRQNAAWSSGDYAVVGTTLQIVGEQLCESLDLRPGAAVLDVAAGNGNATLAAARRFAQVTSTDYVESLLDKGRARAAAENLEVTFAVADVEDLPFADGSFDYVLSTFGVMFAPNHHQSAAEMLRVTRAGGHIGLANWTPASFIGQVFKTLGKHIAPPAGVQSPALWGDVAHLAKLFPGRPIDVTERNFIFRYRSPAHFVDVFRSFYGPVHKAFLALDEAGRTALEADLLELIKSFNRATDGTLIIPSAYAEVLVRKV
ncbi:MAG: class I SAM-dependent methyltransferase [Candidatus Devosia phytovorans]|uniref:Class I SAM-dependent methyltransferase n=1 Tax=Candidatus Devosia phytovorans TaxID=3121372 RepID=A0AAJ6B069_9HYPH|nr:class I SAM-dependent methyltransferase [Devosia sp.]WEK05375.1 MAG: class I SAM-dependent methyltransferase [Devosia sp.]